jgi:hypothetical protein
MDPNYVLCFHAHVLAGWLLSHNKPIAPTVLLITVQNAQKAQPSVAVSN